jgi:hypothetical protein
MKAKCISCGLVTEDYDEIKIKFGFLKKYTSVRKTYKPQAICKACRKKKYKLNKIKLQKISQH